MRRTYRSAMMPKIMAPTGRIASVIVIASATRGRASRRSAPGKNERATSSSTSVRMKKSNASSVHPRNPARTALRWFARSSRVIGTASTMKRQDTSGTRAQASGLPARGAQEEMSDRRGEEPHEPGVVVQRLERRHDKAAPGERATDRGGGDRAPVPAAIRAVDEIEILELQLAAADDPIVRDEYAGYGSEPARIAEQ